MRANSAELDDLNEDFDNLAHFAWDTTGELIRCQGRERRAVANCPTSEVQAPKRKSFKEKESKEKEPIFLNRKDGISIKIMAGPKRKAIRSIEGKSK
ncbi:MAG: hypothetical protein HY539_02610 [Deltaproteobacteria bacterium]|nr:hypothetical protein [Deltaproteobacteria bacterium]